MDQFMSQLWPSVTFFQTINMHDRNDPNWPTAVVTEWGQEDFKIGVDGMTGCTVLIVASRKGAYFAHYWEYPSFSLRWENFQKYVLDNLDEDKGNQSPALAKYVHSDQDPTPPSDDKLFTPETNVRAVIISPRRYESLTSLDFQYPDHVEALQARLMQMLPSDAHIGAVDYRYAYEYDDFDEGSERVYQERTATQKILLQYSPDDGYNVLAFRDRYAVLFDYWDNTPLSPTVPSRPGSPDAEGGSEETATSGWLTDDEAESS